MGCKPSYQWYSVPPPGGGGGGGTGTGGFLQLPQGEAAHHEDAQGPRARHTRAWGRGLQARPPTGPQQGLVSQKAQGRAWEQAGESPSTELPFGMSRR